MTEERAPGDGQEENKKVDDDEDRRNPQYIPKKGMFYEHDDRIDSGDEGTEGMKSDEIKPLRYGFKYDANAVNFWSQVFLVKISSINLKFIKNDSCDQKMLLKSTSDKKTTYKIPTPWRPAILKYCIGYFWKQIAMNFYFKFKY